MHLSSFLFFRVEGQQNVCNARMYQVSNDWKITIKVDADTKNAEVYRALQDGSEEKLVPNGIEEFNMERRQSLNSADAARIGDFTLSLARFVLRVIEFCA